MNFKTLLRRGLLAGLLIGFQFQVAAQPLLFGLGRGIAGRGFLAAEVESFGAANEARMLGSLGQAHLRSEGFFDRVATFQPRTTWLWHHEQGFGTGSGHTLEKHVLKNRAFLLRRLNKEKVPASTSYSSSISAESGTSRAIAQNRAEIQRWLRNSTPGSTSHRFYGQSANERWGYGFVKSANGHTWSESLNRSAVRVRNLGDGKYCIHTSFPIK